MGHSAGHGVVVFAFREGSLFNRGTWQIVLIPYEHSRSAEAVVLLAGLMRAHKLYVEFGGKSHLAHNVVFVDTSFPDSVAGSRPPYEANDIYKWGRTGNLKDADAARMQRIEKSSSRVDDGDDDQEQMHPTRAMVHLRMGDGLTVLLNMGVPMSSSRNVSTDC